MPPPTETHAALMHWAQHLERRLADQRAAGWTGVWIPGEELLALTGVLRASSDLAASAHFEALMAEPLERASAWIDLPL